MTDAIDAIDMSRLTSVEDDWAHLYERTEALPCETQEQRLWWAGVLLQAHERFQELEAERDCLVRPQNESVKRTNAAFKKPMESLAEFKRLAQEKLGVSLLTFESKAATLRQLAADTAKQGDHDASQAALAAIPEPERLPGVRESIEWEAEVVDIDALPPAFVNKSLNAKAMRDLTSAFKDRPEAPVLSGVVFRRVGRAIPTGKKER